MENISRRQAILTTSLLIGGAVSTSIAGGVLEGCQSQPELDWSPAALTNLQAIIVAELAERILPTTDTPGAKAARVERFVDSMVDGFLLDPEREEFLNGIERLERRRFHLKSAEKQDEIIRALADEARESTNGSGSKPFFLLAKEMILLGFFKSEIGATQVLQYDPVPGGYIGCGSLQELGGKVWAT
jgi:gluconate 2-dehydrogenase gamma chain